MNADLAALKREAHRKGTSSERLLELADETRLTFEENERLSTTPNMAKHFDYLEGKSVVFPQLERINYVYPLTIHKTKTRLPLTKKVNSNELRKEIRNNNTPSYRLLEIASIEPGLSRVVATKKFISSSVLEVLSGSEDWVTRARVAHHRKTSVEVLRILALDSEVKVVRNLLLNLNITEDILRGLMHHNEESIRWRAFHTCLFRGYLSDAEIFSECNSGCVEIRRSIATFWKNLPYQQALLYLKDPDKWIRYIVLKRQLATRPLNSRHRGRPYHLNKILSLEEIAPLLSDGDADVRQLSAEIVSRMKHLNGEAL